LTNPQTLGVKAVPENRDGLQHLLAVVDESVLVHGMAEVEPFEFLPVLGVLSVLGFQPIVPGEKPQRQIGAGAMLEPDETLDQLAPETGGGPIVHRIFIRTAALQDPIINPGIDGRAEDVPHDGSIA
jgi:hypothetical protein